jgi:hypothetical protein
MLDTKDAEFGVQLAGGAYRPIRRECSDIKALGTRVGRGVNERMAAQYYTIGSHKLSCWVEMQFRKTKCCYKGTVVDLNRAQEMQATSAPGSVLGSIPKLGHVIESGEMSYSSEFDQRSE